MQKKNEKWREKKGETRKGGKRKERRKKKRKGEKEKKGGKEGRREENRKRKRNERGGKKKEKWGGEVKEWEKRQKHSPLSNASSRAPRPSSRLFRTH